MISKPYGNISRAFVTKLGKNWAVHAFSSKYKRNVNTHVFPDQKEAMLTKQDINK
jgi:hypothetical protein